MSSRPAAVSWCFSSWTKHEFVCCMAAVVRIKTVIFEVVKLLNHVFFSFGYIGASHITYGQRAVALSRFFLSAGCLYSRRYRPGAMLQKSELLALHPREVRSKWWPLPRSLQAGAGATCSADTQHAGEASVGELHGEDWRMAGHFFPSPWIVEVGINDLGGGRYHRPLLAEQPQQRFEAGVLEELRVQLRQNLPQRVLAFDPYSVLAAPSVVILSPGLEGVLEEVPGVKDGEVVAAGQSVAGWHERHHTPHERRVLCSKPRDVNGSFPDGSS